MLQSTYLVPQSLHQFQAYFFHHILELYSKQIYSKLRKNFYNRNLRVICGNLNSFKIRIDTNLWTKFDKTDRSVPPLAPVLEVATLLRISFSSEKQSKEEVQVSQREDRLRFETVLRSCGYEVIPIQSFFFFKWSLKSRPLGFLLAFWNFWCTDVQQMLISFHFLFFVSVNEATKILGDLLFILQCKKK